MIFIVSTRTYLHNNISHFVCKSLEFHWNRGGVLLFVQNFVLILTNGVYKTLRRRSAIPALPE